MKSSLEGNTYFILKKKGGGKAGFSDRKTWWEKKLAAQRVFPPLVREQYCISRSYFSVCHVHSSPTPLNLTQAPQCFHSPLHVSNKLLSQANSPIQLYQVLHRTAHERSVHLWAGALNSSTEMQPDKFTPTDSTVFQCNEIDTCTVCNFCHHGSLNQNKTKDIRKHGIMGVVV